MCACGSCARAEASGTPKSAQCHHERAKASLCGTRGRSQNAFCRLARADIPSAATHRTTIMEITIAEGCGQAPGIRLNRAKSVDPAGDQLEHWITCLALPLPLREGAESDEDLARRAPCVETDEFGGVGSVEQILSLDKDLEALPDSVGDRSVEDGVRG
jgi:hypothetical protein